jgi:8-oxo-dGTP pyrophosphatase MutT (NUDIX family)
VIERLAENLVYQNTFIKVFDDSVRFPDGSSGTYIRIVGQQSGLGVVIMAHHAGLFGLVQTYRYALGESQWGFPRGFAHDENLDTTVRGELMEELGLTALSASVLGVVTPDSGLLASKVAIVWVEAATNGGVPRDTVEVEALRWVTQAEMANLIEGGHIEDAFTLAAWTLSKPRRKVTQS